MGHDDGGPGPIKTITWYEVVIYGSGEYSKSMIRYWTPPLLCKYEFKLNTFTYVYFHSVPEADDYEDTGNTTTVKGNIPEF